MFSLVFFGAVQKGETSSPALFLRKCFEKVNLKKKTKKDWMLFGVQGFGCSSLDISVCLEKKSPSNLMRNMENLGRNGSGDDVKKNLGGQFRG